MQIEKFNFWCFKPSNKALYNFVLYAFAFYGMYTFGIISQIMHVWHMVGHEIIGFAVLYYMTYEIFVFWENWKINQFTKGLGETLLQKFLYIDEKINADLGKEVDEQISCLSTNLQVLLMKLKVPETKARKVTIKKAGLFLMKIPVYLVVFLIIVLWDVFYKNIAPAIWSIFTFIVQFIFWITGLEWFVGYIKTTTWFKSFSEYIEEQKLVEIILVIGFTLIFGTMEGLKFAALAEFGSGEFLYGIYFYIGSIATLLVVKPYNKKFGKRMMTVNWYKIRYEGVVSIMEIFEATNSYKNVMAQLAKVKAILRTIWKQFKAIFSVIKQIITAYMRRLVNSLREAVGAAPLEETEDVNLLDEIKREHDSIWKGIKSHLNDLFEDLKDEKVNSCHPFEIQLKQAENRLKQAENRGLQNKALDGYKSQVTKAKNALSMCQNKKA